MGMVLIIVGVMVVASLRKMMISVLMQKEKMEWRDNMNEDMGYEIKKLSEELMVLKARNRQRNKKIQRLIDNLMKEHYTQHEVELLLKAAKDDNDD